MLEKQEFSYLWLVRDDMAQHLLPSHSRAQNWASRNGKAQQPSHGRSECTDSLHIRQEHEAQINLLGLRLLPWSLLCWWYCALLPHTCSTSAAHYVQVSLWPQWGKGTAIVPLPNRALQTRKTFTVFFFCLFVSTEKFIKKKKSNQHPVLCYERNFPTKAVFFSTCPEAVPCCDAAADVLPRAAREGARQRSATQRHPHLMLQQILPPRGEQAITACCSHFQSITDYLGTLFCCGHLAHSRSHHVCHALRSANTYSVFLRGELWLLAVELQSRRCSGHTLWGCL